MKPGDIRKAAILAAGFGKRLDPLTRAIPKPLLPVCGTPAIERLARLLERWGVREIAVNAHHLADQIEEYAERRNRTGTAKMTVFRESEILGTGGALRSFADFAGDDPIWYVNGDIAVESVDPLPLVEAFGRSGGFASCLLAERVGPQTVEADPEGRVCCWHSPTPGVGGTYTYCGFALLGPKVRSFLPAERFCSIVDAYENAMMTEARFVVGVAEPQAWWSDFGTFDRYLETHLALDPDGFERFPNVLFDGVKLETDAELAGCVATGGLIGGRLVHCTAIDLPRLRNPALDAAAVAAGWKREDTAAVLLGERGSDRAFWRLVCGARRAMAVVHDDSRRAENAKYVSHARLLSSAGLRVPEVLADVPSSGVSVFEDLGDDSLEKRFAGRDRDAAFEESYAAAARWLAAFHVKGTEAADTAVGSLEEPFGPALYEWERNLFEDCYVKRRLGLDEGVPEEVRAELRHAAETLAKSPQSLVHRDFQSSNIIFPEGRKEPAVIDFQGMRKGPAAYDLASLAYDPYVKLTKAERNRIAALYADAAGGALAGAVSALPQAGVQRLVQALGAYGRLAEAGQRAFTAHILPALDLLHGLAHEAALPGLASFTHTLIERERMIPA